MRQYHINKFLMRYFAVWRYYANGRRLCVKRSFRYFHQKLSRKRIPAFPRITDLAWAKNLDPSLGSICVCASVAWMTWTRRSTRPRTTTSNRWST